MDIESIELKHGSHASREAGVCSMELVAWMANEPHSATPVCACPVITGFVISLNDNWNVADRQRLKPFLSRIIGTRSTPAVETKRAIAALDWTMRVHRPLWLDAAGLSEHAAALRALPEIVDEAGFTVAMQLQEKAIADAWAARDARDAWDAIGLLVVTRAGKSLGTDATDAQRIEAADGHVARAQARTPRCS